MNKSAYDKAIDGLEEGIRGYEIAIANNEEMKRIKQECIDQAEKDKVKAIKIREGRIESAHLAYTTSINRADQQIETAKAAIQQHDQNIERIKSEIEEMKSNILDIEKNRDN